ncbi:MAG: hypothetical protein MUP21_10075 [Dehalococcoidia bacterium]|nr:hypothetical protein [Dehalococcoidia bacterium]
MLDRGNDWNRRSTEGHNVIPAQLVPAKAGGGDTEVARRAREHPNPLIPEALGMSIGVSLRCTLRAVLNTACPTKQS